MTSVVKPFLFLFVVEWILDKKYYICKVFETEIKQLTRQLVTSLTIKRYNLLTRLLVNLSTTKRYASGKSNTTLTTSTFAAPNGVLCRERSL